MTEDAPVRLYDAFVAQDAAAAIAVVDGLRAAGMAQDEMFDSVFSPAMAMLGAAWARRTIDEIAFAQSAVVAEQVVSFVTPPAFAPDTGVTIVIGCAAGDTHDITKNVIAGSLKEAGHRVVDLGTDVRPSAFLAKVAESGSRLLLVVAETMGAARGVGRVRDILEIEGMADVVLLVAGGPFEADAHLVRTVGANGMVHGAESALRMVARVAQERLGIGVPASAGGAS